MALTEAGPPLSIDDPEILEPGSLEIILASTVDKRRSGEEFLFPILDLSYGVSQNVQVALVATRAVVSPDDGATKSDFGPGAAGVKWRFLHRERLQMSIAPYVETLLREGAADRGVTEDLDAWVIPVQFQYEFNAWRLNAEGRFSAITGEKNEWGYGIAAAFPLSDRFELMAELHGDADRNLGDHNMLYRVGVDVSLNERWHLLASAGSSVHESDDEDPLHLQGYIGLQWFP